MTSKPQRELFAKIHNTLGHGSYEPMAGQWRASFDAVSRDEAQTALRCLEEQYQAARDVLVRIRQWDMMVGGIGSDGEHREATADAPYWRDQIDRALSYPASRQEDK